ncbi:PH domain-containing protein, partial [Halobium palmae]
EAVVDERDPAQRSALGQAVVSLPFLGGGFYLLYFTDQPYLYPTIPFVVGLYLFSAGLLRYWRNTLTTYFVTNQRVLEEYRFLSLVRNELPLDKIRSVEERRSMWDSLFGLGSVYVRAGSTGGLTVTVGEVYEPTAFADEIRGQLGGGSDADAGGSGPVDAGIDSTTSA